MLMKANDECAIFFLYHTLLFKINYTSVRRLCKINLLKNAGSISYLPRMQDPIFFGNMTNSVYKTHDLFFVFDHKLKQKCGTI